MTTDQIEFWKGPEGDAWFDRTGSMAATRKGAFTKMLKGIVVSSALEVGMGNGQNLMALRLASPMTHVSGIDPSQKAIEVSQKYKMPFHVELGDCFDTGKLDHSYELVFTAGVLMHVTADDLPRAIRELKRVSSRYVLVIEYHAEEETSISYHGREDVLFKRNYWPYLIREGLWQVGRGFLGKEDGFDDCTWLLMRKKGRKLR